MSENSGKTADIIYLWPPEGDLARLWNATPGRKPLTLALAELGYALARTNGQKVCLVDQAGRAERLRTSAGDGVANASFAVVDASTLPTVTEARALLRKARREGAAKPTAPAPQRKPDIPVQPRPVTRVEPRPTPPAPSNPPVAAATPVKAFDRAFRSYPFPAAEPLRIVERAPPASARILPTTYKYPPYEPVPPSAPRASASPPLERPRPELPPALLQQRKEMAERLAGAHARKAERPVPCTGPEPRLHQSQMSGATTKASPTGAWKAPTHPAVSMPDALREMEAFFARIVAPRKTPTQTKGNGQ